MIPEEITQYKGKYVSLYTNRHYFGCVSEVTDTQVVLEPGADIDYMTNVIAPMMSKLPKFKIKEIPSKIVELIKEDLAEGDHVRLDLGAITGLSYYSSDNK